MLLSVWGGRDWSGCGGFGQKCYNRCYNFAIVAAFASSITSGDQCAGIEGAPSRLLQTRVPYTSPRAKSMHVYAWLLCGRRVADKRKALSLSQAYKVGLVRIKTLSLLGEGQCVELGC